MHKLITLIGNLHQRQPLKFTFVQDSSLQNGYIFITKGITDNKVCNTQQYQCYHVSAYRILNTNAHK